MPTTPIGKLKLNFLRKLSGGYPAVLIDGGVCKKILTEDDVGGGGAETDPVFSASEASLLVAGDKAKLDAALTDASAFATAEQGGKADSALQSETDPSFTAWLNGLGDFTFASQEWVEGLGYLTDAASDGDMYVRRNGAWEKVNGAPYNAGNISGATTLNFTNGAFQKAALTDATTLNAPSNGAEGRRLELWLTASGADRALTLHGDIRLPSDSGLTFPKTLTSGKLYIALLRHNGSAWMLNSLVGGY